MKNERKIIFKFSSFVENFVLFFRMVVLKDVILKHSEKSHKSLFPQLLRFFTSFRMTKESDDINLPCHSEAQRRIKKNHLALLSGFFTSFRMTSACLFLFILLNNNLSAQIELIPIQHPVYQFLSYAETKGFFQHFSMSSVPFQKNEIVRLLNILKENEAKLSTSEKQVLSSFAKEFAIEPSDRAVLFYSASDSAQVFSERFFSNDEKFIYHYSDSLNSVSITPLGSIDGLALFKNGYKDNVVLGNLGLRLIGTIDGKVGYFLQATNGTVLSGNRDVAFENRRLRQNVKFSDLKSDFDFSESSVIYQNNWFSASIGRQSVQIGSGINSKIFISDNSPAFDMLSLGAKFETFEYRFAHASILALPVEGNDAGFNTVIPTKYLTIHRFAIKPSWGEFGFFESVVYADRAVDLAYLNPLSFFKNLEHSLRDRDNSLMGIDMTLRPFKGFQIKGSFLLDDIMFDKIGKGFWSNKTASNIGILVSLPLNSELGIEYTRVEPYTFSHFDYQKSYTNDGWIIGSDLQPNSDEVLLQIKTYYGNRYPVLFKFSYSRHGANIVSESGEVIRNVGGDVLRTKMPEDSETVTFLDGIRENTVKAEINFGWEIFRGLNLQSAFQMRFTNDKPSQFAYIILRYDYF